MEFEERKEGERRGSQPSNHLSKHSKNRSGNRSKGSKGRSKKTNAQKLSRTALVGAPPALRGGSEHDIVVPAESAVVDKNRSQVIVQQANDGSVGASESVNSVIKRKERSKSNGRSQGE